MVWMIFAALCLLSTQVWGAVTSLKMTGQLYRRDGKWRFSFQKQEFELLHYAPEDKKFTGKHPLYVFVIAKRASCNGPGNCLIVDRLTPIPYDPLREAREAVSRGN